MKCNAPCTAQMNGKCTVDWAYYIGTVVYEESKNACRTIREGA